VAPAVAALLTIVVIASVPFRVRAARAAADLEHIGIGVSLWHPDQTVDRYRDAGAEFALYLPGDGSTVTLPVRRAADAPSPLRLSFHAGGQLLNEVAISGDGWHRIPISLTSRGWDFELVHFTVTADGLVPADRPVIHVGIAR
jgi:hypothetical protein